jgi:peptidyl-dipeptidase A
LWTGCKEEPVVTVSDDPVMVLDSLEAKLAWVTLRSGQEKWRELTGLGADSVEFFADLRRELTSDARIYGVLKDARTHLTDELDQRRLELVLPDLVRAHVDAQDITVGVADSLRAFYGTEWCRVDGRLTSLSDAARTVAVGRRRSDREAAYRGLTGLGEQMAGQVGRLIRLRNQVARRLGYNDYLSLYARANRLDLNVYVYLIEQVDSLTRPAYRRLLTELRSGFGGDDFQVWDFANRFANTLSEADQYFPVDSQLTYARRAFEALGFPLADLPIYLRLAESQATTADLNLLYLQVPHDIRLAGRLAPGFDSYCFLMEALSKGVHATAVDQSDFLLAGQWDEGWSFATASVFRRLCLSKARMGECAAMPSGTIERFQTARRAVDLLDLRLLLVDAMFEYEAYRSTAGDLNEVYWDLFEQYVEFPAHRDLQPWAGKSELTLKPLAFFRRLEGKAAGAQTWKYLKEHYASTESAEMGSFLRHNYFRFGARYDWPDLVERATGQPSSAAFIAEPY